MDIKNMLWNQTWRWVDHSSSGLQFNPLQSFALDDTFCASVGEGASASIMRAWVHHPTIVLGIQDTRLPYAVEGIQYLEEEGYRVIVRNSGGLAVVLDEGIFNLSLIFKENKKFSIHSGYDFMWELIRLMFPDAPGTIDAYEVKGSYCPGDYDLSIGGKKFAGISQRRIRGGAAVQIYLAVTKSGAERAKVLQRFYQKASKGEATRFTPPQIEPQVMSSLNELFGKTMSINDILYRLLTTFQKEGAMIKSSSLQPDEFTRFENFFDRVLERNNKAIKKSTNQC
ncbi:lipoate--protein ligase family protein [Salibacterium salarium]